MNNDQMGVAPGAGDFDFTYPSKTERLRTALFLIQGVALECSEEDEETAFKCLVSIAAELEAEADDWAVMEAAQ